MRSSMLATLYHLQVLANGSVTNGLALYPNLHKAFNNGMVAVDDTCRIVVLSHLREDSTHTIV
ncbi:HNH endonuclease [Pedobacter sp. JCM 36344]|uniref:HNH endonuclease n=1 Tax=Pedobacter sp. JCM 36344 TaxID=3374280 RepID=UPI00397A32A5